MCILFLHKSIKNIVSILVLFCLYIDLSVNILLYIYICIDFCFLRIDLFVRRSFYMYTLILVNSYFLMCIYLSKFVYGNENYIHILSIYL